MRDHFDLVHHAASRSLGLVTRAHLVGMGIPDRTVTDWTAVGRLRRVGVGVFLVMGAPWTWETRVLAACLEHGAVASHRTAAVLHGVPRVPRTAPEVVKPHAAHHADLPGVRRTRHFDDLAVGAVGAIPTVGAGPLALQLTTLVPRRLSLERFETAVEHLVRTGSTSWTDLDRVVADGSRRRTPGIRHLRALVGEYLSDGCESRLERGFLAVVAAHGLPAPVVQFEIVLPDGRVVRVDFAYPAHRLAVELDSLEFHTRPEVFVDDREKRRILRSMGWQVDEYTHRALAHHAAVIARDLRASLAARAPAR